MKRLIMTLSFLSLLILPLLESQAEARGGMGRPRAWCGWYMRTVFGGGPELNLARNWARVGSPAQGPAVGTIVVWRNHVGRIVGETSRGEWVVNSGNDSHAVRTRVRSLRGAIAFRWPGGGNYRLASR